MADSCRSRSEERFTHQALEQNRSQALLIFYRKLMTSFMRRLPQICKTCLMLWQTDYW